jgi:hypothetical protein
LAINETLKSAKDQRAVSHSGLLHRNWEATVRLTRRRGHLHGSSTRPFAALPDLVLDRLAFAEFFKGYALDRRMVKEQIVPFTFDEPVASFCY